MELPPILSNFNLGLFVKIPLLTLLFLFFIFTLVLLNQTRALARIVHIQAKSASLFIRFLMLSYVVAALSLFLVALVIL